MNIFEQMKDNIFNADHRNAMIEKYGYTEAMRIKIEDLIPDLDALIIIKDKEFHEEDYL